jgi:hypothetical protein
MAKTEAIESPDFPGWSAPWGPHGRFTIKKKGVSIPPGFVSPKNWKWQIQKNHTLENVGDPFENRAEAILAAFKYFSNKTK